MEWSTSANTVFVVRLAHSNRLSDCFINTGTDSQNDALLERD